MKNPPPLPWDNLPKPAPKEQHTDALYHRARYGEHYVGMWMWRTDWLDY